MVAPSDMDDETERLIRQLQQQDAAEYNRSRGLGAVSYTHLTLPTILLV